MGRSDILSRCIEALALIQPRAALMACILPAFLAMLALVGRTARAEAFVGSTACTPCHASQAAAWNRSHHRLAMQPATAQTVLGDFDGATFRGDGIDASFVRKDGRYFVRTAGPDGKRANFEVKYTFGWTPLQQYLLEMPRGRLQAFPIAWDTRPKEKGGQRWFNLYPGERAKPGDELHWAGLRQNWNHMCADCHSTALRKGYDATSDTFRTSWAEINVGCEACHGPGSNHIEWAKTGTKSPSRDKGLSVALDERRGMRWTIDPASGNAARSAPRPADREIEVCAQCHARRAQIADGYVAGRRFFDHYLPAAPEPPLYFANGQQKEEVYNWGSFIQSRMYAKGVTCSDCHEPHSGTLRAAGNAICAQCHLGSKYDDGAHHRHKAGTAAAQCVSCHMPSRVYMVIDARHDHGFSIPRPADTVVAGAENAPNACNGCHKDKDAKWAAAAIGKPAARPPSPERPDDFKRMDAADRASLLPPRARLAQLVPVLRDPRLAVRVASLPAFAELPRSALQPEQRAALDDVIAEYRAVQAYNADRPEAHVNLGGLEQNLGRTEEAEKAFETALRIDPRLTLAYLNYADLRARQGRESDAEQLLRRAIALEPASADAHHALGLSLFRQKRTPQALAELERAARLRPETSRYAYVHAVALHDSGDRARSLVVLQEAYRRHPRDPDILEALAQYAAEAGDAKASARYRAELQMLSAPAR